MQEINDSIGTDVSNISSSLPDVGVVITIVLILVAAYLIVKIADFLLRRISERAGRYRITVTMVIPLMKIIVYVSALYFIIRTVYDPGLPNWRCSPVCLVLPSGLASRISLLILSAALSSPLNGPTRLVTRLR